MPEETTGMHLVLDSVSKTYDLHGKAIEVLRGVNLEIEAGSRVAIVGPSGSGKSTILSLLGMLDRPTSGRVLHNHADLRTQREDVIDEFRNRHIGFVFQFHHLLPEFTALENVMMPAIIGGQSMDEARAGAENLLEAVGLAARVLHRPGELSGGEQQRVALARALILGPKLVLADEPTGNLDPETGKAIHDLMLMVNSEFGTTLVVATHNRELAARMPRRIDLAELLAEEGTE
jgi:lipoprotein-releasing system ATP-binding protein